MSNVKLPLSLNIRPSFKDRWYEGLDDALLTSPAIPVWTIFLFMFCPLNFVGNFRFHFFSWRGRKWWKRSCERSKRWLPLRRRMVSRTADSSPWTRALNPRKNGNWWRPVTRTRGTSPWIRRSPRRRSTPSRKRWRFLRGRGWMRPKRGDFCGIWMSRVSFPQSSTGSSNLFSRILWLDSFVHFSLAGFR